jgi:hypothetical protein
MLKLGGGPWQKRPPHDLFHIPNRRSSRPPKLQHRPHLPTSLHEPAPNDLSPSPLPPQGALPPRQRAARRHRRLATLAGAALGFDPDSPSHRLSESPTLRVSDSPSCRLSKSPTLRVGPAAAQRLPVLCHSQSAAPSRPGAPGHGRVQRRRAGPGRVAGSRCLSPCLSLSLSLSLCVRPFVCLRLSIYPSIHPSWRLPPPLAPRFQPALTRSQGPPLSWLVAHTPPPRLHRALPRPDRGQTWVSHQATARTGVIGGGQGAGAGPGLVWGQTGPPLP